jgi:short subunit dehydrogenase-like uncharacterized protein
MLLLYGANGYTGRLIVDECLRRGLRPILAGRRADALRALAEPHGLAVRAFDLDGPIPLEGVRVVLHAAGPFIRTSAPMVEACLAQGVHYLDITGEIAVFEACRRRHEAAQRAGVVLLPGVGFDVVPTDCLAARLAATVPDATLLELAFGGGGGVSRGTLKTMLLGGTGGAVRRDGRIVRVPSRWKQQRIPFRDRPRDAVTIPWGDVSTAHWSTGVPDIHTYLALPRRAQRGLGLQSLASTLLRLPVAGPLVERLIDARVDGPDATVRASARMQVWGRVTAADGRRREGTAVTPEGYAFTALAAVECARRVLEAPPAAGYHTPSTAFGAGFLESLPGCDVQLGPAQAPDGTVSAASADAAPADAAPPDATPPDTAAPTLNRGHYFEVLDRVHVLAGQLEEVVGRHPVVRRHPELQALCDDAAESLAQLYQAIGRQPAFDRPL